MQLREELSKDLKGSYKRGLAKKNKTVFTVPEPPIDLQEYFKKLDIKRKAKQRKSINRFLARNPDFKDRSNSFDKSKDNPFCPFSNKRKFSTNSISYNKNKAYFNTATGDMFHTLDTYFRNKNYETSEEIQLEVEKFLLNFKSKVNADKPTPTSDGLAVSLLSGPAARVILNKLEYINKYIELLLQSNVKKDELYIEVLRGVGASFIRDNLIYHLLKVLTHTKTEHEEMLAMVSICVKVGKELVNKYFSTIKGDDKTNFRVWTATYLKSKPELKAVLEENDRFFMRLGDMALEVLNFSELMRVDVVTVSRRERRLEYKIVDPDLLKLDKKDVIAVTPLRLPMIVEPKDYKDGEGGYLLNNVDYSEDIFTDKHSYKLGSELAPDNKVLPLVNSLNKMPFKINTELLDFVTSDIGSYLLIKSSDLELEPGVVLSKYKQNSHKKLVSKFVHQEFILKIANLYRNFNSIYYPVRLDHRGRLYCMAPYLNYQGNDLAKALLLFSYPGTLDKSHLDDVKYLKAFGANCFGGAISKSSVEAKCRWIDDNVLNIINYENGILIKKAKEKLLFVSFCIEYKRYINFLNDDLATEFKTYLPIQLDATCNGFQHLSLLSQESKLYDELNLTNNDKYPKDFYNFLLHKVTGYIKYKIANGIFEEELKENKELKEKKVKKGKKETKEVKEVKPGSYLRLSNFIWDRSHVKKVIMTIPYNAGDRAMRQYIIEDLVQLEYDTELGTYWYKITICKIAVLPIKLYLQSL
uniref:DNA-directed RNA polymerase n=1 Tax=Pseudocercospora mori TaxID=1341201 RepID=A0A2L1K2L1_9PEZI|nr:hypothetical protein [Pseudocercospora mori]AVE15073.1 hypothetical protein [Pseudocercospora mori]